MRILRPLQAGVKRCLIGKSFDQNIEVHLEPKGLLGFNALTGF